jgi:hypothetical protein
MSVRIGEAAHDISCYCGQPYDELYCNGRHDLPVIAKLTPGTDLHANVTTVPYYVAFL